MMSALVRFSIRFYGVIIGLASLLVFFGIYSLVRSNLDVFPEFSPTQIIIQTESPGLSAELVETLVSQPIETSIAGTVGVADMRSQSTMNFARHLGGGVYFLTLVEEYTVVTTSLQIYLPRYRSVASCWCLLAGIGPKWPTRLVGVGSTVLMIWFGVRLTSHCNLRSA